MMNSELVLRRTARDGRADCLNSVRTTMPAACDWPTSAAYGRAADRDGDRAARCSSSARYRANLAGQNVDAARSARPSLAGAVPGDPGVERVCLISNDPTARCEEIAAMNAHWTACDCHRAAFAARDAAPSGGRVWRPGAGRACWPRRPPRREPIRWRRGRRTFRPGPSGSSSCSCTAGRRRSTRSTTSRCSSATTASRCRSPSRASSRARPATCSRSPWKFQPARPERRLGQRAVSARRRRASTTCASSTRCTARTAAHGGALLELHTGSDTFVRPSMGSWITYGLGTENQDLPGFVTICPTLSARRREQLELGVPAGRLPGDAARQRRHARRPGQDSVHRQHAQTPRDLQRLRARPAARR